MPLEAAVVFFVIATAWTLVGVPQADPARDAARPLRRAVDGRSGRGGARTATATATDGRAGDGESVDADVDATVEALCGDLSRFVRRAGRR